MTVTEVNQAIGSWSLRLSDATPREILDALQYFGHIAIVPGGRVQPAEYGDSLLTQARYVGVLRTRDDLTIGGCGMAFWLGDEEGKGDVFETAVTLTGDTFADSITALLPPSGAVTAGTIHSIAGTYTGIHRYQTSRKAIGYVTQMFDAEWRVNGDGTLDAGTVAQLYRTTPQAFVVRRDEGRDLFYAALAGEMSMAKDSEDFTTRVFLLAEGEGDAIATGEADIPVNPYNDIHGNDVVLTRVVSESDTTAANADARAALILGMFSAERSSISLSSSVYDIKSNVVVGDYVWVWDPDTGFKDNAQEVQWNGQVINPIALRCMEMTWPVRDGWTIAFRDNAGNWYDLSPYYEGEGGGTSIVVGELNRSVTSVGTEPPGTRPPADISTPATPVFGTFESVAYQSQAANDVRAAVYVNWAQPLNTDGSTILDGDHYEIRYRATQTFNYQITWAQAGTFQWNELQTWGRPLSNPAAVADQWITAFIGWGTEELTVPELMVSAEYEFQIRAVDNASPPNQSAWSASTFLTTRTDTLAPKTPAVPEVASSLIAIQVIHRLGDSDGGEFNLAQDLHHLEVHVGGEDFLPVEGSLAGTLVANSGHINGHIPVVGTFQIPQTEGVWVKVIAVDRFGNKSSPSDGVQAQVELIDSAHIDSLTASKITAGTITANILMSGAIRTAETGQRVELNQAGIQLFDADGNLTVNLTADDDTPNFISITNGDQVTVASIDSLGNISGQHITAADDITIDGQSLLDDLYDPLPKGVVAYGEYTITDNGGVNTYSATGIGSGNETGFMELSFVAVEGRRYRIVCVGQALSTAADEEPSFLLRDGGADTPTVSSPMLTRSEGASSTELFALDLQIHYLTTFTAGLHRLLWTFYGFDGTLSIFLGNHKAFMYIEDTGSAVIVPNTAIINPGAGTSPPPVTTYTRSYAGNWSQTYNESGSQKSGDTLDQGDFGDSAGNRRSLIGFPYSSIMSDLSGATIQSIKLTLYAEHWYNNSGGTAVIGTHSYTAKPGTWADASVNQNRTTVANWPKPGKKTVLLSNATFGADFKSGAAKGIALGPGNSTSLVYYGKFSNTSASTTGNRPVLTIVYTK